MQAINLPKHFKRAVSDLGDALDRADLNRPRSKRTKRRHSRLEYINPTQLRPDPTNARVHSPQQIRALARNMQKYGFTNPILVNSDTLAGNHDMYCGGVGFYKLIKTLNPAPFVQPASFFCLRTSDERWQFLAMDTGLHDYNPKNVGDAVTFLESDELEWHCQRIKEFPGKTILLSHHQLFSAFSKIGPVKDGKRSSTNPRLHQAFVQMNEENKVAAWFWGHEHTLSIYEPYVGLQRGRCLGHGAIPTSTVDKIYETLPDLVDPPTIKAKTQLAQVGGVYAHGYSTLELQPNFCSATYFQDMDGQKAPLFEERID